MELKTQEPAAGGPASRGHAARFAGRKAWSAAGLCAAAVALALTGCSPTTVVADTPTVTTTVKADKSAPPTPEPTTPAPPAVWPLTGQPGVDPSRPVVSVKIENLSAARPQSGLDQADVVFEEVVEGGISRFVAMFQSQQPDSVGPIRSVRPMDGPIAGPTHGLLVFSGGQQQYQQIASDAGLQLISHDAGAAGFHRNTKRSAPHNTYGSIPEFAAQADAGHAASPATQFTFASSADQATAALTGSPVAKLSLVFSSYEQPGWTWDAAAGAWARDEKGKAHLVASGAQIHATNVVALSVQVHNTTARDPAGNPVPETVVIGSGSGQACAGGKCVGISWTKPDTATQIQLTGADGQPVALAPGNTWFELVPDAGSITLS